MSDLSSRVTVDHADGGGVVTITVTGEIDRTNVHTVAARITAHSATVNIDLSRVQFLGLAAGHELRQLCRRENVTLTADHGPARRTLELLDRIHPNDPC